VVRACTGDGKIAFVHSKDIADVAIEALTSETYRGESLAITGPEALTYADMTAKIGAAIGKPLRFQRISDDEECQKMKDRGEPAEEITAHLSTYRAIREGRLVTVTDTVQRVLGRKPTTFDQWVQENATAFL
jgi:uncharacterized protein YbjT (DUF2867 family)